METIRILIVDDNKETRENVASLISFERKPDIIMEVVGEAENGEKAVRLVNEKRPHVVLMDINMPVMDGIKATHEITNQFPDTAVILMSVQGEQEYLRKAMTVGARDYLTKPFSGEDMVEAVLKAYFTEKNKRKLTVVPTTSNEDIKSKIITVFSTKGGVGKTTIATNLAVSMARISKKKVALVDLDLQFGDVSVTLNISMKATISDLVKEINQLDAQMLDEYMVTHFSGLNVLSAPEKPEYAEYVTSSHIEKILKLLKENYHYIIIDTTAAFHETVLTALDMSDKVLMVSTLDLPTVKNIGLGLDVMKSLNYPAAKIKLVLNKASEQYGVKYKDLEDIVKLPIWMYIPEDNQTVITTANKGLPFVMTRSETKVSRALLEMAEKLTVDKEDNMRERGLLRFFSKG